MSAAPTRRIGSWVADQINPAYWKPNAEIKVNIFGIVQNDLIVFSRIVSNATKSSRNLMLSITVDVVVKGFVPSALIKSTLYRKKAGKNPSEYVTLVSANVSLEHQTLNCCDSFFIVTGSMESSVVTENGCAITPQEVTVRKYGEVVTSTVANVASAIDYPLSKLSYLVLNSRLSTFVFSLDQRISSSRILGARQRHHGLLRL